MTFYSREEFGDHLTDAGFHVVWDDVRSGINDEESWIIFLATVPG